MIQRLVKVGMTASSRMPREMNAALDAIEQDQLKVVFQAGDLAADGSLGNAEFLGRASKILVPSCHLECEKRSCAWNLAPQEIPLRIR
jgi:hypothetical protein